MTPTHSFAIEKTAKRLGPLVGLTDDVCVSLVRALYLAASDGKIVGGRKFFTEAHYAIDTDTGIFVRFRGTTTNDSLDHCWIETGLLSAYETVPDARIGTQTQLKLF